MLSRSSILANRASRTLHMCSSTSKYASSITTASLASKARPVAASAWKQQGAASAAFHGSAKNSILPPLPQRIDGTMNDPAPIPHSSPTHGSYHWGFERAVSVALIPLTIAPFAAGSLNPVTDAILCGAIVIHSHIGFQSIITDYLPKKRVPKSRALFWWGLNAGTVLVAVGLYEFETNDVGVTEAIKRIWTA